MSNYSLIFKSKLCSALNCAIEDLDRIEKALHSDGTGALSGLVSEQIGLFFQHLLKYKSCLLMKDNGDANTPNSPEIVDEEPIDKSTNVEFYGVYKYSSYKCRRFESNLESITVQGIPYVAGNPGDEVEVYLSDLIVDSDADPTNDIYYEGPVTDGIVVDRDDILRAICQLRNHYRAIVKYLY
jgi:hypothetical protein